MGKIKESLKPDNTSGQGQLEPKISTTSRFQTLSSTQLFWCWIYQTQQRYKLIIKTRSLRELAGGDGFSLDCFGVAFVLNDVQLQVSVAHVAVSDLEGEVAHGVEAPHNSYLHRRPHQKAAVDLRPTEGHFESIGHVAHSMLLPELGHRMHDVRRAHRYVQGIFALKESIWN